MKKLLPSLGTLPNLPNLSKGPPPVGEAPAVWSIWHDNALAINTFSPAGMTSSFVTGAYMGGPGYQDLDTKGFRMFASLVRKTTFVVPTAPDIADTDLLVTTIENPGAMLNGVNSVQPSIGSYAYQIPDAAVPAVPHPGVTQAVGKVVNAVQVGHLRLTNWAGATFTGATQGSAQWLQLVQLNADIHPPADTSANLRFGPIYRVKSSPKPCVCLIFDDQHSEQYTGLFPLMQARSLVGNIMTDINAINQGGARISFAQALEMQAAGWCFALDSSSPVTSEGTIAAKLAWLASTATTILGTGLGTPNTMKYLRYSWGSNAYPVNNIARSLTANGTNILTGVGINASGAAQGAIIKGNVLDGGADAVVVRPVSDTQIEVNRTVTTGTYANARLCAIEANRTLTADGTPTVTAIDSRGIVVGMVAVGNGIPFGTTVTAIPVDSATGTVTLSANATGTTSASFYLPGAEWLRGKFMDAAFAAGFRAGFTVSVPGSGIYTGMGVPNMRNLMGVPVLSWEGTAAAAPSAGTIFNLQQLIRNGRDVFPFHHWANSFAAVPGDVTNAIAVLDFIRDRRNAGDFDVVTLDQWYNRVAARTFPA